MYALIDQCQLLLLNRLLGSRELMDLYADVADWDKITRYIDWEDAPLLPTCGCCVPSSSNEETPLNEIFARSDCFSLGFHGMMDAYSFDIDRAKRCCVHALAPDGRLIPFCLYNIKYRRQYQSSVVRRK
jgi:hypothetical protein